MSSYGRGATVKKCDRLVLMYSALNFNPSPEFVSRLEVVSFSNMINLGWVI